MALHSVTVLFPQPFISVDGPRHGIQGLVCSGKCSSVELPFLSLKVSLSKAKRRAKAVKFFEKTPVSLSHTIDNPLTNVGGRRIIR